MLSVMGDKRRSLTMSHSVEWDITLGQLLEHCKLIHWLGWAGVMVFVLTLQLHLSDLSQHVGAAWCLVPVIAWIRHQ